MSAIPTGIKKIVLVYMGAACSKRSAELVRDLLDRAEALVRSDSKAATALLFRVLQLHGVSKADRRRVRALAGILAPELFPAAALAEDGGEPLPPGTQ